MCFTMMLTLVPVVLLISNVASLEPENIVNGIKAKVLEFPYQVSIQAKGHFCGGTLIAANIVLTAAHCVYSRGKVPAMPYQVVAGVTSLRNSGSKLPVVAIYAHKLYRKLTDNTALNDIALLKLGGEFDLGPTIALAGLPQKDKSYEGKTAVVSGFGWNKIQIFYGKEKGSSDNRLYHIPVDIISSYMCKARTHPEIICGQAQPILGPSGVCTGDSGGPLAYRTKVIGIVSSSPIGCDESQGAAIYTNVAHYISFIKGVLYDRPTRDTLVVTVNTRHSFGKTTSELQYPSIGLDISSGIDALEAHLQELELQLGILG